MRFTRRRILKHASLSLGAGGSGSAAADTDCSDHRSWNAETAYSGGDRVVFERALWEAQWWTRGNEPDESDAVWTEVGGCDGGGDNEAPTASFTVSPAAPDPDQAVSFDASDSSDSDGTIGNYEWAFGDDTTATGESVTHAYDADGSYAVTLTVTDDAGATDSTTRSVSVGDTSEFKVIGYSPGWKSTPDYDYYPEDVPWSKLADVKYAVLGVDAQNGVPTIMSDQDRENLEALEELKSGPASDTRIHVSIGG